MNELQPLSQEEVRLFLQRIGRSLAEKPLDLQAEAHRERLAELLRLVGEASWYELLGVQPADPELAVHAAYERLARTVHPDNARRLGLDGKQGVLEMLFERATQAYLTLSDPERRRHYDREVRPTANEGGTADRASETRELARGYYEESCRLADEEQFHFAIELAQRAARTDPRQEYFALLGRLQAMNPHPRWLRWAAENLQEAMRRGPASPDLKCALDEVLAKIAQTPLNATPGRGDDEEDVDLAVLDPEAEIAAANRRTAAKKKAARQTFQGTMVPRREMPRK